MYCVLTQFVYNSQWKWLNSLKVIYHISKPVTFVLIIFNSSLFADNWIYELVTKLSISIYLFYLHIELFCMQNKLNWMHYFMSSQCEQQGNSNFLSVKKRKKKDFLIILFTSKLTNCVHYDCSMSAINGTS